MLQWYKYKVWGWHIPRQWWLGREVWDWCPHVYQDHGDVN